MPVISLQFVGLFTAGFIPKFEAKFELDWRFEVLDNFETKIQNFVTDFFIIFSKIVGFYGKKNNFCWN